MPDHPSIDIERHGLVAWIVASNPARLNAWSRSMWAALPAIVADAEGDPDVRVIVLRGAGDRAFSAGADISEFEGARTGEAARTYDALAHAAVAALAQAAKPTIAMIHGVCFGGGLSLALACDLRLGDDAMQFAIPAAKLGIGYHPQWVELLLGTIGPAVAKDLIFTGRRVASDEALEIGLVNRLFVKDALQSAVRSLAEEIASNAPLTIRAAKQAINQLARDPRADVAPLEALTDVCFSSADYAEGREAFREKRVPRFLGR